MRNGRVGSLIKDKKTNTWFVRVYVGKSQRAYRLGHAKEFGSKAEVWQEAEIRLRELGKVGPGKRETLEEFLVKSYLPEAERRLRPSTAAGYRGLYERYLQGRRDIRLPLFAFRTVDIQRILDDIADNNNLSKLTLQHTKHFLGTVFRHAIAAGMRENNPVRDALLPNTTKETPPTAAYTLNEVVSVLETLKTSGTHRAVEAMAAVAIAAFAGLRLAEIQGLSHEDYEGDELSIHETVWRGEVSPTKSKASRATVPVIPMLSTYLDLYRRWLEEHGESLTGRMFPMDLVALGARHIKPAFRKAGVPFRGWHSFRRGLATSLFALGAEDIVVQRILRHSDVGITKSAYIKVKDKKVNAAMGKLSNALRKRGKRVVKQSSENHAEG